MIVSEQVTGTAVQVTNQPCVIKSWQLVNTTAAEAFLQIYDAVASSVTVGTTTPKASIPIGANATEVGPANVDGEIPLSNALTLAATTTRGGSTSAPIDVLMVIAP